MNILVINTGSSSIKYQLFHMEDQSVRASGLLERIGEPAGRLKHSSIKSESPFVMEKHIADHETGMREIAGLLTDAKFGVIKNVSEVAAIGHRVVHGGEAFHDPVLIDDTVIKAIEEHIPLAPLHNPANLTGIRAAISFFPGVPQVGIFDTAFHTGIPRHAYHYAIPNEYYKKLKIRRYGFHGTSHSYVAKKAAEFLDRDIARTNLITIHLGNGCSITAIKNGQSIDTSMGMTPLEGLIMGTRSGDIDPAIHFYLADHSDLKFHDIDNLLNKESGLKGLTGTNDMRDILKMRREGSHDAVLAVDMYTYRIKKYIGAYYAALGKLDAVVFTAGIGENSAEIRALCLEGLEDMGIAVDSAKNESNKRTIRSVQAKGSKIAVLIVPTNEELEIALQTQEILRNGK